MTSRAILLCMLTLTSAAQAREAAAPPPWQRVMQPLRMAKTSSRPATGVSMAAPQPAAVAPPLRSVPRIRYLGSLQRGDARYLFAEVNGQVYSVRAGSELGGLYRLEAIDTREARFVYLPTHENVLVSLD